MTREDDSQLVFKIAVCSIVLQYADQEFLSQLLIRIISFEYFLSRNPKLHP